MSHASGYRRCPSLSRSSIGLPLTDHRDPFDRLLVAQACVEGLGIISSDAQLDQYDIKRHW